MDTIKKDTYASSLFSSLSHGKNSYMRIDRLESSSFDMSWINAIEDCIYDLGDIVTNPRQVTKTVSNIVPVELAKKIGAESVMHLASHTQYIKEITEQGDVVPNKILSMSSEDDIHTYENRFIATLIRRLVLFIQKRYEFVKKFAPLHDEEILYYKTKAIVDGSEVEIETKIKVKSESDTKVADISNKYIARILQIREYIMFYYGSKFMKELKTERDVRNPIVMTNILRKNPKYHKCYELYKFIEKYDKLGVSYKVDEDISVFNEKELEELNTVMFTNYLALKARDRSKVTKNKSKIYKPRILTSLDDEQFIYGDLLEGPIEFLRVDQGYQDYLDSLLNPNIPLHPTKVEKEYYQEEIKEKAENRAKKAALEKLDKRKKKEKAEFDKKAAKIIAQREKEERERIAREAEEARLAEERRIEAVRQSLIEQAMGENNIPLEEETPIVEEPSPIIEDENIEEDVSEVEEENLVEEEQIQEEIPAQEEDEIVPETEEEVQEPVIEETEPQIEEESIEEQIIEDASTEDIQEDTLVEKTPVVEESQEESVIEETPTEEEHIEEVTQEIEEDVPEELAEEIIEEETPQEVDSIPEVVETPVVEEQVQEEASIEEVKEEPQVEPAIEESPVIEETPTEEPKAKKEKKARKPRKPRAKVIKEVPIEPKEEPIAEQNPVEEVTQEIVEETPVIEEKPVETPKKKRNSKPRKPKAKAIKETPEEPHEEIQNEANVEEATFPIKEEPQNIEKEPEIIKKPRKKPVVKKKSPVKKEKEVKKPAPKKVKKPLEKIPGKFIVKTNQGYYVNQKKVSVFKHEAKIFDDFNEANKIKKLHGGKVVKL